MGTHSEKPHHQTIDAMDIVEELKQGSKGPMRFLRRQKKQLLPLEPHTLICGRFDLKNLVIDKPLEIRDCHFEGEVDLRNCEFKQIVDFSGCTFDDRFISGGELEFHTIYRKDLICNRATFARIMSLHGAQVEGGAHFSGARFRNTGCSADFSATSFKKFLKCSGAKFAGEVSFRSVECGQSAIFTNAGFAREVDFRFLEVGRDLDLSWTYWADNAKLGEIQVSKKLLLEASYFCSDVELYDSSIGTLELWDPNYPDKQPIKVRKRNEKHSGYDPTSIIPCEDSLMVTSIVPSEDRLKEWRRDRERSVSQELENRLKSKTEDVNLVNDLFPFKKVLKGDQDEAKSFVAKLLNIVKRGNKPTLSGLNLTSTTFERFHGGPHEELAKALALKLADSQDPTKFSIDPYLQLRNHYLKIGDETTAGAVRASGYRALRINAWNHSWKGRGRTKWSWKRRMAEILFYWPTSYGHRIWPILLPAIGALFILGTFVFWPQNSLTPIAGSDYPLPYDGPLEQKVLERSIYSLDLLVPALNLRYESMWVPQNGWVTGWIYATVHSILGWIFIALFITWLTGVIKPRE